MVTIQTADNALKSFYLDAITEALDMKTNPFLAQLEKTTADVVGKDVRKVVKIGVNGGISASSETGDLPTASSSDYVQMIATLKNLYGTVEISDKAIRASGNNEGSFVNLLNEEMQSLVKSASFNFGRMLFGDGSGVIAKVTGVEDGSVVLLDNISGVSEGMIVDFCTPTKKVLEDVAGMKIVKVDRANKKVWLNTQDLSVDVLPVNSTLCVQASIGNEITGLEALFSDEETLYGVDKTISVMTPYQETNVGEISESIVQKAMDTIERDSGSKVNFIICSWGVRRAFMAYCRANDIPLPTMDIGGFKALDFNGVPIITDRFCPDGTMYLLNTEDFRIHQLCDWQWLEGEDGKILKQIPGKPVYTATLVKYAELLCSRPCGQGKLSGITEA